ncbi:Bug family tripartite tricarboxylate transporter substrate binding protein [Pseudaquabacterium rugosum]|uniref:Tripartite tricarboxylate transporter substrate binding protein n=1 Tax=Pseudaquabacterium rugosum TaxID=2984194 RepID=A0ABU9BIY0_9BURK
MTRRRFCRLALGAASAAGAALTFGSARAADPAWPTRPLRIVVPFAPGGGTDIVARALAGALGAQLRQPVAVENKPGGATVIGADSVAKADADAHVLLISGSSTFTVNPALRSRLPYDPMRDLAPIARLTRAPVVLVVRADAPWKTLPELIAAARARPGGLAYASFGPGSAPQLAGAILGLQTGAQFLDVPYKGSAPALTDLLGGQLQFLIDTAAATAPQVRAGALRALAVLDTRPASALPEVPTLAQLKLPGAAFDAWYGLAAPGKLPEAARATLERATQAALADPAVQATIRQQAMEPAFVGRAALRPLIDDEITRFRMVAARARIVLE